MQRDGRTRSIQELETAEIRRFRDAVDLADDLLELEVQRVPILVRKRAVLGLNGQLPHAHEDVVHFVQSAFRRLDQADAIVGVSLGLRNRADLSPEPLTDGEAGGVVRSARDPESGGELTERTGQSESRSGQVALSVQGRDVRLDSKTHGFLLDRLQRRVFGGEVVSLTQPCVARCGQPSLFQKGG